MSGLSPTRRQARPRPLLSACLVCLAFGALAPAPLGAQALDRYFPAAGVKVVALRVDEGQVHCQGSSEGEIHLVVRGRSLGTELRPLDLQFEARQRGDTLVLALKVRRKPFLPSVQPTEHIDLAVPLDIAVRAETDNGNIDAYDLGAGASLATLDDIRVERCDGELDLATQDGTAWVRDFDGPLRATARDGRIDVAGRLSWVRAEARDGTLDIRATEGSGLEDQGGAAPGWLLRTRGGEVRLKLPRGFEGALTARCGSGEIDPGPYPVSPGDSTASGRTVRIQLGKAGRRVHLESDSGSITLR